MPPPAGGEPQGGQPTPGRAGGPPRPGERDLVIRLNRIEGHVRAVKRLIQEGAEPDQVLLQISAVQAALRQVALKLLEAHLGDGAETERLKRALKSALK